MTKEEKQKRDERIGWYIVFGVTWCAGILKAVSTGKAAMVILMLAMPPVSMIYGAFAIVQKM